MTRNFSLQWMDFHTNLYQSLDAFLNAEELVDVTLSAGGKNFRAHKLILSICSPFFKELFRKNTCENPIVVLKEVEHIELYKLLQFIYHGEVHVTQQELNPFLETAEFLQIKGLASVREKNDTAADDSNDKEETKEPKPSIDCDAECDSKIKDTPEHSPPIDSVSESIQYGPDPNLKHYPESTPNNDNCSDEKKAHSDCDNTIPVESNLEAEVIEPKLETVSNNMPETVKVSRSRNKSRRITGFKCIHCHAHFTNRYNLKVHIDNKHERENKLVIKCYKCHKRMRNYSCLRVHMYKRHKPVHREQGCYYKPGMYKEK